ncbi:MAG: DUF4412 domain-containing protein [Deltaproteobacteria bacterium]|nr:DUF4412 domain-containing protein [Deltaproteobacteria bacterium]
MVVLFATAARAADFEGVLKSRVIEVAVPRLVVMLGRDATEPSKVFSVPIERFVALSGPDSGVQVKDVEVKVRGSKLRVDTPAKDYYAIVDTDSASVSIVRPAEKRYLQLSKEDRRQMNAMREAKKEQGAQARKESTPPQIEVKALGKTQTINGMKATAYEVRTADGTSVGWIADGHKDVARIYKIINSGDNPINMMPSTEGQASRALASKGLAIRIQTLDLDGYHVRELVSLEKKSFADDIFALPADFTKQKTPSSPD